MTKPAQVVFLAGIVASSLCGQPRPARPAPTTKVATVNGKPLTVGGVRDMLRNAPESVLQRLRENPKDLLVNYALTRQLSDEARGAGLDKKFPYAQRLDWQSLGVLMNAQIEAMIKAIEIPETEIRAYYDKNILQYRTMRATVIRVTNEKAGDAAKAKAMAEDVVRQARAGAKFADLGEKYSSEPDLAKPGFANTITPDFDLPEAAKARLFATLPGQVTDPIQMVDSYVIFRVEELKPKPLSDVRAEIKGELQQQRSGAEIEKVQKTIQTKVLMPQFFSANAPNPEPGAPRADSIDPAAIIAEVNGRRITAKDMADAMQGMAPTARQAATKDPARFLLEYETLKILAAEARKAGLDKKPPASDHIFWSSDQVLMQAQLDEKTKSITNTLQEQEDYYKNNQNQFRQALTKLIYLAYSVAPPPGSPVRNEAQTLQRAMEARRKFEGGTDFTQLVKEYSEDADSKSRNGDMGLRYADPNVPAAIRDAVFGAKDGQLAGPVRLTNGFYLFLVKENKVQSFEEVRNDIYNFLSDEKFKKWFDESRGKIQVTIDDEAALKAELAYH